MSQSVKPSLLILAVLTATTATGAQSLSLDEALRTALGNNFSFRISRIEPEIARDAIERQSAAFEPEIFASGNVRQQEEATGLGQITGYRSDARTWEAGVRKRLAYGTTVSAQTTLIRSDRTAESPDFNNFSQNVDLSVSVRQPLLRGFGRDANLAGVEGARAGLKVSEQAFRDSVLEVVAQTELAYWQVARWEEQLELDRSNLEVAETLLEEARERERVGLVTRIEVLQAQGFKAQRQEEIIETTRSLGDAADDLLALMGVLPGTEAFSMEPSYNVQPLPEGGRVPESFSRAWQLSVQRDPLLAAQEAVISQREWDRIVAKNSVQPNLDLVLSGGYAGFDDRYADDAFDNALEGDGNVWAVGVEFSLPWSLRGAKAALRSADRQLEQETLRYEQLEQSLYRDVRSAWRALDAVGQSLEAARITVSLQEATFEREKSKHEEGLSNFRDVLQAQSELDQARVRMLLAKYNKLAAEIGLSRLTGTLLDRHGLNNDF